MNDPVIFKLKEPIRNGSEIIDELKIRKPKAKDIRNLPSSPNTGNILDLAGKLCGHPPSVIDELCIEDVTELLEIVANFMVPGQRIGKQA